jgi:hypothetical protein
MCGSRRGAGRPRAGAVSLLALAALAGSCASYPHKTGGALSSFERGDFGAALAFYGDSEEVGSEFLSGAEAGTVALAAGDWDQALVHLHRAADAATEMERRALAGPEAFAEGVASWALNDRSKTYAGEGFERVYVHAGLAMAYLAKGQLDSVYVEARRGNRLLEAEEELYDTTYRAGGLGHLVSALAYELLGQRDDAYIDYRRMEEKGVGTELAGPELVRLAGELGRPEDQAQWAESYEALDRPRDAASIVVLAGVGLGPYKEGGTLPIPTNDGLISVSGSTFRARPQQVTGLVLSTGEREVGTVVVEDVASVAAKNLSDRQVWMVTKSIARGLLKRELTKALEREYGWEGQLAGDLFSFLSERPDLRSWLTLPDTWQAVRLYVPPGGHSLTLRGIGGGQAELGTFELEPGETMLVFARALGGRLHAHAVGGQPIEERP